MSRSLNDAFVVDQPWQLDRRDYVPGDVNRESVYNAWEQLIKLKGKSIPADLDGMSDLAVQYMEKAKTFKIEEYQKSAAYTYFGMLLLLKVLVTINDISIVRNSNIRERELRHALREIERRLSQEQLTPIIK